MELRCSASRMCYPGFLESLKEHEAKPHAGSALSALKEAKLHPRLNLLDMLTCVLRWLEHDLLSESGIDLCYMCSVMMGRLHLSHGFWLTLPWRAYL